MLAHQVAREPLAGNAAVRRRAAPPRRSPALLACLLAWVLQERGDPGKRCTRALLCIRLAAGRCRVAGGDAARRPRLSCLLGCYRKEETQGRGAHAAKLAASQGKAVRAPIRKPPKPTGSPHKSGRRQLCPRRLSLSLLSLSLWLLQVNWSDPAVPPAAVPAGCTSDAAHRDGGGRRRGTPPGRNPFLRGLRLGPQHL
jgi:hypothetical protein